MFTQFVNLRVSYLKVIFDLPRLFPNIDVLDQTPFGYPVQQRIIAAYIAVLKLIPYFKQYMTGGNSVNRNQAITKTGH